jgi:tRNA-uridine 2-sulfurtransferase
VRPAIDPLSALTLPTPPPEAGTLAIVAMSGGVDSAVAALLLRDAGWQVQGLFMRNWHDDGGFCTTAQDLQDARATCRRLGIELHEIDFADRYRDAVFAQFLAGLSDGVTPNPDVLCNREIKFGVCLEHARRLGAAWFATGHYARLEPHPDGGQRLTRAVDADKDQTYFLHAVPRQQLTRVLFPIGGLTKAQVRERARAAGLGVHNKPDSTGICFIGERPFREFLSSFVAPRPGPIESIDGAVLGTHDGLALYTLGQRDGLRIGGRAGATAEPWYVAAKDLARNALIVVQGRTHPLLLSGGLQTGPMAWLEPARTVPFRCLARLRHRQPLQSAVAEPTVAGGVRLAFDQPQRAVTPGQYAVLYDGAICLGGAPVIAALPVLRALDADRERLASL